MRAFKIKDDIPKVNIRRLKKELNKMRQGDKIYFIVEQQNLKPFKDLKKYADELGIRLSIVKNVHPKLYYYYNVLFFIPWKKTL